MSDKKSGAVACPFDVRSLDGRTFGSVADEIAPGWQAWGFSERGRFAAPIASVATLSEEEIRANVEIRRIIAVIVVALRERAVELVTIDGAAVPLWVWLSGRWAFYRDERGVERLEALTAAGEKVEYFNPRFAAAAQPAAAEKTKARGPRPRWPLVAAECRRRYKAGERHPGRSGEESPIEWARVLLPWLRKDHPAERSLRLKTATNNLSKLLRRLKN
jgi:hypothetical protein